MLSAVSRISSASQDQMELALAVPAFQIFGQLTAQITVFSPLQYFWYFLPSKRCNNFQGNSKWETNEFGWGVVWFERTANFGSRGHT